MKGSAPIKGLEIVNNQNMEQQINQMQREGLGNNHIHLNLINHQNNNAIEGQIRDANDNEVNIVED